MLVDLRSTGVISDNGWQQYTVEGADSLEEAAYLAVRFCHRFLHDGNHTWRAEDGCIRIFRTEDAVPPPITPVWARSDFKAGAAWFASTRYRAGEPGTKPYWNPYEKDNRYPVIRKGELPA